MSDTQHYRFQSEQAKRLARQVADTTIREKLLEMADEYGRYADLIEAGSGAPMAATIAPLSSRQTFPDRMARASRVQRRPCPIGRISPAARRNQFPASRVSPA